MADESNRSFPPISLLIEEWARRRHKHSEKLDLSMIDAKGDLIAGIANDKVARHAVGSDYQALLADSNNTTGLGWGANIEDFNQSSDPDITNTTRGDRVVRWWDTANKRLKIWLPPTPALANMTGYTVSGNEIVMAADGVTVTNLGRTENEYAFRDYGSGAFGPNLHHRLTFYPGEIGDHSTILWGITNTPSENFAEWEDGVAIKWSYNNGLRIYMQVVGEATEQTLGQGGRNIKYLDIVRYGNTVTVQVSHHVDFDHIDATLVSTGLGAFSFQYHYAAGTNSIFADSKKSSYETYDYQFLWSWREMPVSDIIGANGTYLAADSTSPFGVSYKTPVASEITYVPSGGISATELQAAIAELDAEKITNAGGSPSIQAGVDASKPAAGSGGMYIATDTKKIYRDNGASWILMGTANHTLLSNIGTNTHAQVDTHISDGTIHFTEGSVDHGALAGLTDDDHTGYVLVDGTRAMTGGLTITPSTDVPALNANNHIKLKAGKKLILDGS